MNPKLIAIFKFLQGINPLTTKDGIGKKPRKTTPDKKLRGLFVLNPKPFTISEIETLVDAYNPQLVARLSPPKFKDGKQIPSMLWVGQDFAEDTDEELSDFMEGL